MPNVTPRLCLGRSAVALVALAGMLLSSCSVVGGGGKQYKLTAWFPKTIALFPASEVRVLAVGRTYRSSS